MIIIIQIKKAAKTCHGDATTSHANIQKCEM